MGYVYLHNGCNLNDTKREKEREREMCHCINKEKTNEKTNFTRNN
jgi:hypothetical protein